MSLILYDLLLEL